MDVHVRHMITVGLRLRGVDVLTVQEDGRRLADDTILLDRAAELNRVMFTNDDDFLAKAQYRQRQGIDFIGVIYTHQRTPIGKCVHDLELIAKVNVPADMFNQVTFLPL
ncbi:MAG: DUF5615 family PIN-like protein [Chloroflexota bacterium]